MRLCSNTSLVPRPWPVWERDRPRTCLKNYEERWCLCCIVESLPYCKPFRRRMLSGGMKDYQLPRLKVGTHKNASVCDIWSVTYYLIKKFFLSALLLFFPLSISLALWQPNLSGVIFIFCCDFCSPLTVVELLSGVLGAATLHVQLETLRKVSNIWAWQTNSTSAMSIKYSLMILFSYDPVIGAQYDFWQLFLHVFILSAHCIIGEFFVWLWMHAMCKLCTCKSALGQNYVL